MDDLSRVAFHSVRKRHEGLADVRGKLSGCEPTVNQVWFYLFGLVFSAALSVTFAKSILLRLGPGGVGWTQAGPWLPQAASEGMQLAGGEDFQS